MRIAFFVAGFPTTSETFILSQITGLIDRGHDVDIFATKPSEIGPLHEAIERYNLLRRTHYRPKMLRNRVARLAKGAGLVMRHGYKDPLATLGCINIVQQGVPAASMSMLYDAVPILGKGPYDVVHAHFGPRGELAARLQEVGVFDAPLVATFYGYDVTQWPREYRHGDPYCRLFTRADRVLCLSQAMADRVHELGCPLDKLAVHHLGVPTDLFKFRSRVRQPNEPTRLLTVARLAEKKGIPDALEAVARARDAGHAMHYTIIGDGALRQQIEQLIEKLSLADVVTLAGSQPQHVVAQAMQDAHLFLLPSKTAASGDEEGTPTVLMEAMATGLPVLSTLHSGIPEVVIDKQTGYLVSEGDIDALTDALTHLLENPNQWATLGQAGRSRVEAAFDSEKVNDQLVQIYREVQREWSHQPITVSNN